MPSTPRPMAVPDWRAAIGVAFNVLFFGFVLAWGGFYVYMEASKATELEPTKAGDVSEWQS